MQLVLCLPAAIALGKLILSSTKVSDRYISRVFIVLSDVIFIFLCKICLLLLLLVLALILSEIKIMIRPGVLLIWELQAFVCA